jgi:DNA invertase Pin-like site-specific DNA recombinase
LFCRAWTFSCWARERHPRTRINTLDRFGKADHCARIDTTTPHGRLTISILASITQFERELILSRISDGRKRARQNGIKFGRKPSSARTSARKRWNALLLVRARVLLLDLTTSIARPFHASLGSE